MREAIVLGIAVVLSAGSARLGTAQEWVDSAMAARVIAEASGNSHAMQYAFRLADVYGPRLTGSPGFKMAGNWALEELERIGLANVRKQPVPWGRSWVEHGFDLRLLSPAEKDMTATAVPWSSATPGDVAGEVVLAPLPSCDADHDEYLRFYEENKGQLRGRVVLGAAPLPRDREPGGRWYGGRTSDERLEQDRVESERQETEEPWTPAPSEPYRNRRAWAGELSEFLRDEGVAAVLYPSRGFGGEVRLQGALGCRTQYAAGRFEGFPLPPASAVVAWEHYNRLARLLDAGIAPVVRMNLEAELTEDPDGAFNVLGEIPGSDKSAEVVLIGAHLDSWTGGTGATDNASGAVVMMEAMRILTALNVKPRRTIRIALWAGEEGAGLGSRVYVREHLSSTFPLDQLADPPSLSPLPEQAATSAYFNLDQTGYRIRGIYLEANEAYRPIFESWFRPFESFGRFHLFNVQTGGSDHTSFNEVGVPGFFFVQDGSPYAVWTAHSSLDLYDHLVPEDLQQSAAIIAFFAYQAAMREELLPRRPAP